MGRAERRFPRIEDCSHRGCNFIDYRVDNTLTRDRANFVDFIHYRPSLADRMAEGIAKSIKLGNAARIDF